MTRDARSLRVRAAVAATAGSLLLIAYFFLIPIAPFLGSIVFVIIASASSFLIGLALFLAARSFLRSWPARWVIPVALGLYFLIGVAALIVAAAVAYETRGFVVGILRPDFAIILLLLWPLWVILFLSPGFGA